MTGHVSHTKLHDLLARGNEIVSRALGRVGIIVEVDDKVAYIADSTRKNARRYVTSFERGDRVCLVRTGPKGYILRNYKKDIDRAFRTWRKQA